MVMGAGQLVVAQPLVSGAEVAQRAGFAGQVADLVVENDGLLVVVGSLLVVPLGVASGSVIFMALFLLGATMCFWTVETSELTNIVTDGGREMLSYPISIYHPALRGFFLFVVPLAFGSYVPACYILGRPLPFGLPVELAFAAPLLALAFALATGIVWRFGIRHYQSTGS